MKYLFLFVGFILTSGCSSLSDVLRATGAIASTTPAAIATANPNTTVAVIHTAAYHSAAQGGVGAGSSAGSTGVVAATAAAVALSVQTPAVADNGAAVPVTITGLNLYTGESARIFADNCEVLEITNYGKNQIQSLSTSIKLNKSSSASTVVSVESAGRQASSAPIKVTRGSGACNKNLGLNVVDDVDFTHYGKSLTTDKKSLRLTGNSHGGVTNVKAIIHHPMETGNRTRKGTGKKIPAHYITNVSILQNQQEIAAIKATPALAKNPTIALVLENQSAESVLTMQWRDNKDKVGKNTVKIQ